MQKNEVPFLIVLISQLLLLQYARIPGKRTLQSKRAKNEFNQVKYKTLKITYQMRHIVLLYELLTTVETKYREFSIFSEMIK